jgi:hypothetical protein
LCCTVRTTAKSEDNQEKGVRIKYRERTKKIPPGDMGICVLFCRVKTKGKMQENQDKVTNMDEVECKRL